AHATRAGRAARPPSADADRVSGLHSLTLALGGSIERAGALAERLQTPVRARADAGAQRSSELGAELRRLGAAEVELRQAAELAARPATGAEVDPPRLS